MVDDAELRVHVTFEAKIAAWIEIDVSIQILIFTLLHFPIIQLQFDVRIHSTCIM